MRKHLFVTLSLLLFACLGLQIGSAQLPGGIKIPRAAKSKAASTLAEAARPAPVAGTQPDASVATINAPIARPQTSGPTLVKTRVQFYPWTLTSHKGNYDVWSWVPRVKFNVKGAVPSGAHFYVEVGQSGGAPWVNVKCEFQGSVSYDCDDRDGLEGKATVATGVFPFAVKMKNELQGTDQTLFAGRVKVEKALTGGNHPPTSKKFVFYANHDANLPVGQVYYEENDNYLYVRFWVRGDSPGHVPHLFYQGQEVTSPWAGNVMSGGVCSGDIQFQPSTSAADTVPHGARWTRIKCYLQGAVVKPVEGKPEVFAITRKPGQYEVKVLRKDKLARSIKFTVGPDGNLVDNGVGASIGMAELNSVMVPVAILDDQDGQWDKSTWKTEAFYGNPPKGFTWPPQ